MGVRDLRKFLGNTIQRRWSNCRQRGKCAGGETKNPPLEREREESDGLFEVWKFKEIEEVVFTIYDW